ncbi:MAG: heparinase II/III family protein [Pseudomonadota bacterium]
MARSAFDKSGSDRAPLLARVQTRLRGGSEPVKGIIHQPVPRMRGSYAKGCQLIAGNFRFAGHLIEDPGASIWGLTTPDAMFAEKIHGCEWLDDLAAVGDGVARKMAQAWVHDWIARFGMGGGLPWKSDLVGRRLIRWISHAIFLMNGQSSDQNKRFFSSLSVQAKHLGRYWSATPPGLSRFEALTGLLYAGISLDGLGDTVLPVSQALARECESEIDATGGLSTRSPEELMEVFTLLTWAALAVRDAGHPVLTGHSSALDRIAPALRMLRHADGGLARFHGGGRGAEGQLDQLLDSHPVAPGPMTTSHMGFVRLEKRASTVIVDASAPPSGRSSLQAHASCLSFELTSARNPVIVNCGSGAQLGAEWRRAGRATPSHSTLCIDGVSTARLKSSAEGELIVGGPRKVTAKVDAKTDKTQLFASHDAYLKMFGLTHVRKLELDESGAVLSGEDTLGALDDRARARFEDHMDRNALSGVSFSTRFHLHPDIDPSLDMGGTAISLTLKNREVWVFRSAGAVDMRLDRSVFLEKDRLKPRPSQQIVLTSRVMEYGARVSWVLVKAQEAPLGRFVLT